MENEQRLLIVEDNIAEAIYAQKEAAELGFRRIDVATNLSDALRMMPSAQRIASDLFFPAGDEQIEPYVQRFSPLYKRYKETRFPGIKDNMVLRAIEACAEIFGTTPKGYVEDIMPKMNDPKSPILKAARDAIAGIKDSDKYNEFLKIEEALRNGTQLPLGIYVIEEAKKQKTPTVIVTSTYHHDAAFEPVRNLITVPYFDTLVEGRKNWKSGIERLISV